MPAKTRRKKHTTVSIPITLFKKIQERIADTGFSSVSEYVTYVLREIFAEEEKTQPKTEHAFTPEDEKRVKDRLRALGYID
ncbi:MAG: ribbon-helix-helix domain-containing protein [Candidatus Hermodarchaeota archaeon]|jgi:metal-responsive CopG/Arc/MetJ family transcriptional regulator|nr:ribbon-helix-helix domain-containing protein [Candidatus Hermodarchaeota archaeon]